MDHLEYEGYKGSIEYSEADNLITLPVTRFTTSFTFDEFKMSFNDWACTNCTPPKHINTQQITITRFIKYNIRLRI